MPKPNQENYPYPSFRNPILLPNSPRKARQILQELSQKIAKGELVYPKYPDKIPALPRLSLGNIYFGLWCFDCFEFIREAQGHRIIKNRHDARFWGLKEKKAFCGYCLLKRLDHMPVRKQYLWSEYQKRGYWKIN